MPFGNKQKSVLASTIELIIVLIKLGKAWNKLIIIIKKLTCLWENVQSIEYWKMMLIWRGYETLIETERWKKAHDHAKNQI